jgi:hypothetical protein
VPMTARTFSDHRLSIPGAGGFRRIGRGAVKEKAAPGWESGRGQKIGDYVEPL